MKKRFIGSALTAIFLCAIMGFNSFAFPTLIANISDVKEVRVVENPNLEVLRDETNITIDLKINSITEEEAVNIAVKRMKEDGREDVEKLEYKTRYVKAIEPLDEAMWCVTFYYENERATSVTIDAKTGDVGMFSGVIDGNEQITISSISYDLSERMFYIYDKDYLLVDFGEYELSSTGDGIELNTNGVDVRIDFGELELSSMGDDKELIEIGVDVQGD